MNEKYNCIAVHESFTVKWPGPEVIKLEFILKLKINDE